MGYYSTVREYIEIKPTVPLNKLQQLIDSGLAKGINDTHYRGNRDAQVEYYSNNEVTDQGILIRFEGWRIIGAYEGSYKAYSLIQDVQEIVDILGTDTYRFLGYLQIEGEGDGSGEPDIWRLTVKDGKVKEIKPKLVWPED